MSLGSFKINQLIAAKQIAPGPRKLSVHACPLKKEDNEKTKRPSKRITLEERNTTRQFASVSNSSCP